MERPLLLILISCLFMGFSCEKNEQLDTSCLKGKLVLKGICMNYVIELVEGNIDPSRIEKLWINPWTKTEYKNVFALGSTCDFPATIGEGQEFYFSLNDRVDTTSCVQCTAYSPVPEKKLYITICNPN